MYFWINSKTHKTKSCVFLQTSADDSCSEDVVSCRCVLSKQAVSVCGCYAFPSLTHIRQELPYNSMSNTNTFHFHHRVRRRWCISNKHLNLMLILSSIAQTHKAKGRSTYRLFCILVCCSITTKQQEKKCTCSCRYSLFLPEDIFSNTLLKHYKAMQRHFLECYIKINNKNCLWEMY